MQVSFVIPLYNCLSFTQATLASLQATLSPGLQHEIIRTLSEHHQNVLVVGDDAQSIYSFRAADVKNTMYSYTMR